MELRLKPPITITAAPALRGRAPGVDAMRAVFALWVAIFAHGVPWAAYVQGNDSVPAWLLWLAQYLAHLFQPFGQLHPAVVGFIVLSGYCIHRAGFRESRESLRPFAIRRAFRIVPVYLAGTAAGLVGLAVARSIDPVTAAALSGTQKVTAACLGAKLTGVAALVPAFHPCSYVGNAPLATVMFEMWLYVLYAVFFWALVWRGREKVVWIICAATFLVGVAVAAGASRWPAFNNWWQNSSVFGALPYWWIGTLFLHPRVAARARLIGFATALAWLLIAILPGTALLAEVHKLCFALTVGAVIVGAERVGGMLVRPFAALGRAGYSLYAFHAPLTYTAVIAGATWWVTLALNIAAAALAYVLIEKPCIAWGKRLAAARGAAPAPFTSTP
jgi:peptidoglycan/LPS O-acetylase OafA/YrhL